MKRKFPAVVLLLAAVALCAIESESLAGCHRRHRGCGGCNTGCAAAPACGSCNAGDAAAPAAAPAAPAAPPAAPAAPKPSAKVPSPANGSQAAAVTAAPDATTTYSQSRPRAMRSRTVR